MIKRLLPALLCAFSVPAVAQSGVWSDDYHMPGLYGRAYAVGSWNVQLVAGGQGFQARGSFSRAGGYTAFGLTDYVVTNPEMIFEADFEQDQ